MIPILIATAVVAAIGLLCGLLLAVTDRFMHIQVDERETKIRACLPGANCGACGFTGCDGYAKALATDPDTPTNLCIPGSDSVSHAISDILGVAFADTVEEVAFVLCNGGCGKNQPKTVYAGIRSCAAARMSYGGSGSCTQGCLGLGDCVAVCPQDAICIKEGVAHVDPRKCVGCGLCARTCPNHIISMRPDIRRVVVVCSNTDKGAVTRKKCESGCIGCMKCQKTCPNGAIKVTDNLARIDYSLCTSCGQCALACPVGCIHFADFSGKHLYELEEDAALQLNA